MRKSLVKKMIILLLPPDGEVTKAMEKATIDQLGYQSYLWRSSGQRR